MKWGYHLILDCKSGKINAVTDADTIENFVKDLVVKIEMKAYGEPIIKHFAEHDENSAGYTLIQLIETSNICCHFVDKNGDFYLDVFSCKYFNKDIVKEIVVKYFQPANIKERFIERNAE